MLFWYGILFTMKKTDKTTDKPFSLKDFRTMLHGCDISAMVLFEVDGKIYKAVSAVEKQSEAIYVQLEPVANE